MTEILGKKGGDGGKVGEAKSKGSEGGGRGRQSWIVRSRAVQFGQQTNQVAVFPNRWWANQYEFPTISHMQIAEQKAGEPRLHVIRSDGTEGVGDR